jgi:hypothetical protein
VEGLPAGSDEVVQGGHRGFRSLVVGDLALYVDRSSPAGLNLGRALSPWLLLAPVFAAFNCVSEEVATWFTVYYAGDHWPAGMKIAASAMLFGVIHYASGTPSGVIGFGLTAVLGAGLMGLTLASATLRYAVVIHFFLDLLIYAALIDQSLR